MGVASYEMLSIKPKSITTDILSNMSLKGKIRFFLWRLLGVDYNHILRVVDDVYLKEDPFTFIGPHSYNNHARIYRWSNAPLRIGKYCAISYGVKFVMDDGKHKTDVVSSYPFHDNKIGADGGITIGNDVWIGMNATILHGVKIGNGVTVAAGAVVTSDIPDYCVAGGIPAKIVKRKCSEEEAAKMNHIAWWDWDDDIVEKRKEDFSIPISRFLEKYFNS